MSKMEVEVALRRSDKSHFKLLNLVDSVLCSF